MKIERLMDDMMPVFPSNDIICKDCAKRKKGIIGFKNAYCDGYPEGKPHEILFENEECYYYEEELINEEH